MLVTEAENNCKDVDDSIAYDPKERAKLGEGQASRYHILSHPFLHMEPFLFHVLTTYWKAVRESWVHMWLVLPSSAVWSWTLPDMEAMQGLRPPPSLSLCAAPWALFLEALWRSESTNIVFQSMLEGVFYLRVRSKAQGSCPGALFALWGSVYSTCWNGLCSDLWWGGAGVGVRWAKRLMRSFERLAISLSMNQKHVFIFLQPYPAIWPCCKIKRVLCLKTEGRTCPTC